LLNIIINVLNINMASVSPGSAQQIISTCRYNGKRGKEEEMRKKEREKNAKWKVERK
jgi:hypothetical protein